MKDDRVGRYLTVFGVLLLLTLVTVVVSSLDLVPALGLEAEYWPTFDPSLAEGSREQLLMEYRAVRDGLDRRIAARFPRPSTG